MPTCTKCQNVEGPLYVYIYADMYKVPKRRRTTIYVYICQHVQSAKTLKDLYIYMYIYANMYKVIKINALIGQLKSLWVPRNTLVAPWYLQLQLVF